MPTLRGSLLREKSTADSQIIAVMYVGMGEKSGRPSKLQKLTRLTKNDRPSAIKVKSN